jgi:SAM-dependent methyltransferase
MAAEKDPLFGRRKFLGALAADATAFRGQPRGTNQDMPNYVVEFGNAAASADADGRLDGPAFHRNHKPIWTKISKYLIAKSGDVLEIGSGTGQHAIEFARLSPQISWWPSDLNAKHLQSIAAWRAYAQLPNVQSPMSIDVSQPDLDLHELGLPNAFLAIFCSNVLHIAPWRVTEGLIALASRHLRAEGHLLIYGPFKHDGRHTSPSNAEFDRNLRSGNPEWGVRDICDLQVFAKSMKLNLAQIVDMPANNKVLVFVREV